MSNAFRGQTQYAQSPMGGYGGYGGQMGGYGGGYGMPMGGGYGGGYGMPSGGGYGTTFGGYDMGGGGYGQQQSLVPQYQPTINDLFSQYFSQQYYGGPSFDPFGATSFFGGGYGGGFGGGMGRRGRRRRDIMSQQAPQYGSDLTTLPVRAPDVSPVAATGMASQGGAPSVAAWVNMPPEQQREYLAAGGMAPFVSFL